MDVILKLLQRLMHFARLRIEKMGTTCLKYYLGGERIVNKVDATFVGSQLKNVKINRIETVFDSLQLQYKTLFAHTICSQ